MPDTSLEPDQLVDGRFRIRSPRGWGSYGVVWKAWHELLQIPLAIKEIDVQGMDQATLDRIQRECLIGGKLTDVRHVVQVSDALRHDHSLLIVMKFMEGGSLDVRLRGETIPFVLALQWAIDLCTSLAEVHDAGVIHRDIKPQNILLDARGNVYLSDFGIAHIDQSHLTTGSQPGTKRYKAPELDEGHPATPAADVYSLCAVFFQLWSGLHYADLQGFATDIVRDEFMAGLKLAHSDIPELSLVALADAILAGLLPVQQRIELPRLRQKFIAIQEQLTKQGEPANVAIQQAQEQVAATLRPIPSVEATKRAQADSGNGTALVDWLIESFERYFQDEVWNGTRRTLFFWFDEEGLCEPILPQLEALTTLIVDRGSLLEVRYHIERRDESLPTIVYLRRSAQDIGYLIPYKPLTQTITVEPFTLLRAHHIALPDSGSQKTEIRDILPRLITASMGRGAAFWERITSVETARAALLGDVQERVQRFMITPSSTWAEICAQGQGTLFAQEIANRFGYSSAETAPDAFANGLFSHWCLVEVFQLYQQPADYPFRSALPAATLWPNCRGALRQLRYDSRAQAVYVQYCRQFERTYAGLLSWAERQPEELSDAPLPGLARLAWSRARTMVAGWDTRDAVLTGLHSHLTSFKSAADSFWAKQGAVSDWQLLVRAGETVIQAENALTHSELLTKPEDFVEAYTSTWWQVDRQYRLYRSSSDASESIPLHTWVEQSYRRCVEQINRRWTDSVAGKRSWPPYATAMVQTRIWADLARGNNRRAVFLVDALRYDLAQDVAAELQGEDVALQAAIAGLPSITPLGMAALLPDAERQQINWDGDWRITLDQQPLNLADKSDRLALLTQRLQGMQQFTLADLTRARTKLSTTNPWLIVFSTEIDAWGENASQLSLDAINAFVQRLAQGIRKVLDAGYEAVHLLTDHGFLLIGDVSESDKVAVPAGTFLKRDQRYLVGRDLPQKENLLRFPLRGSNDLFAYYTYGTAMFATPGSYHYSHGGPTLQEVVVPYLSVKRAAVTSQVHVQLEAPDQIFNAVYKVALVPERRELFDHEPREVQLSIQRADGKVIYDEIELVDPAEPVRKTFRLRPTDDVPFGSTLTLILRDQQTGEELDRKNIVVQVNIDLF